MRVAVRYLTLSQVARRAPGGPVHVSAAWRWCRVGLRARNGCRVRLDHVRAGRRVLIAEAALNVFFHAVADADLEHFALRDRPGGQPVKGAPRRAKESR